MYKIIKKITDPWGLVSGSWTTFLPTFITGSIHIFHLVKKRQNSRRLFSRWTTSVPSFIAGSIHTFHLDVLYVEDKIKMTVPAAVWLNKKSSITLSVKALNVIPGPWQISPNFIRIEILCANQSKVYVRAAEILSKCLWGKSINSLLKGKTEITQTAFMFPLLKCIDWFSWEANLQGFQWYRQKLGWHKNVHHNQMPTNLQGPNSPEIIDFVKNPRAKN